MLNIAIVEDDRNASETLRNLIHQYSSEFGEQFHISEYPNAVVFLDRYKPCYDIIFMDIELPHMTGMEAARKLRKLDATVILIFVTKMKQYAVKGYEVAAMDFLVKPVTYYDFLLTVKRAISNIYHNAERELTLATKGGLVRLYTSHIKYIEIIKHHIVYHTEDGDFTTYGTLKELLNKLDMSSFALCKSCYLVNLRHVTAVRNFTVTVAGEHLEISHPKKKSFLETLNNYIGGSL